jgi:hypothetical protein
MLMLLKRCGQGPSRRIIRASKFTRDFQGHQNSPPQRRMSLAARKTEARPRTTRGNDNIWRMASNSPSLRLHRRQHSSACRQSLSHSLKSECCELGKICTVHESPMNKGLRVFQILGAKWKAQNQLSTNGDILSRVKLPHLAASRERPYVTLPLTCRRDLREGMAATLSARLRNRFCASTSRPLSGSRACPGHAHCPPTV